jgi:hypothetical protein
MRRRTGDKDEELAEELAELAPTTGDLGAILLAAQDGGGNAALSGLMAQVEAGEEPATALLPGQGGQTDEEALSERERQAIADRATHGALSKRLLAARSNQYAKRFESELTAFERRLNDAREYGWLGTDAAVLSSELGELEDKLRRAEAEEEALQALAAVDFKRRPLNERAKKAVMERVAMTKPGMALYAPEDFETLLQLEGQLVELRKRLDDNALAVIAARGGLGTLSDASTANAKNAAGNLAEDLRKIALLVDEHELTLGEITDRHARANAEDRERLNKLMVGLEPRYRKEPHKAMAGGAGRQEMDYLIKKAWLEQHDATQRLAKDELWELVAGFSPNEGKVAYFDLPERMDRFRMHFSLDYGVMKAVEVGDSESDIRDKLLGGSAATVMRSHVTAEVLGRNDDRNPRFYYNAGRVTPKRDFWGTREGKSVKRNWSANQGKMIEAFNVRAAELVKIVDEVIEQRKELKAVVVKVGESLKWAE